MVKTWKQWCRLCARENSNNTHYNILIKTDDIPSSFVDTIGECFSIDINQHEEWPRLICTKCHQLVTLIINFRQRAIKVQAMYAELLNSLEDLDAGQIKVQYNLNELSNLEMDLKLFSNNSTSMDSDIREEIFELEQVECINQNAINPSIVKTELLQDQEMDVQDECSDRLASSANDESSEDYSSSETESDEEVKDEPKKTKCRPKTLLDVEGGNTNFTTTRRLKTHKKCSMSSTGPIICDECGKTYKTASSLKEHMVTHNDDRPFKCTFCDKYFKTNSRLRAHEDTHSQTNYICTICGQQLNTRRTLKMHMVIHSDQKCHKCEVCGNEYKRAKTLKNHLTLHSGLKRYKCNFCEKTFANSSNCRCHEKKAHPPAELEAKNINGNQSEEYNSSESDSDKKRKKKGGKKSKKLAKAKTERETFTCVECKKEFFRYHNYRQHMQAEHEVTLNPPEFPCSKCCKYFTTPKRLEFHIRIVHMGEKPFICEECGNSYKSFSSLKEHRATHTDDSPFKCTFCDKRFKTKFRLKTHEDTHNKTNYICNICGLQLNTSRTLRMHMFVHSDQKPHKCDYCGNEYKRAKALKNHLILHTGLKPYTCNFCDRTFANGSNCRTHKKKAHPVELAAMEAAGKKSITTNIPKLEQLRAATLHKAAISVAIDAHANDGQLFSHDTREELSESVSNTSRVVPDDKGEPMLKDMPPQQANMMHVVFGQMFTS